MDPRITVFLEYPCILCADTLCSPQSILHHMNKKHAISLDTRAVGKHRPKSELYRYVTKKPGASEVCATHAACPSCWEHFPNREQLYRHIHNAHSNVLGYDKHTTRFQLLLSEAQPPTPSSFMDTVEDLISSFKSFAVAFSVTASNAVTASAAQPTLTATTRKKSSNRSKQRFNSSISHGNIIDGGVSYAPSNGQNNVHSAPSSSTKKSKA